MKTLIVYHANCIDGITSAAAVHKACLENQPGVDLTEEDILMYPMSYDDSILELQEALTFGEIERLYIVDFSFDTLTLHNLAYYCPCIRLLDHHASAFRNLMGEEYTVKADSHENFYLPKVRQPLSDPQDPDDRDYTDIHIILDNRECGASLCYKKLVNPPDTFDDVAEMRLPILIKYVKDYDLWRFEYPDTKLINKYLKQQSKTVHNYLLLLARFDDQDFVEEASNLGHAFFMYEKKIEDAILERGTTPIAINGVTGLSVNAPYEFATSLGNSLAEKSETFGAVWAQLADGKVSFSLRSIGDSCDVSILAELMGGGGHKNASGFTIDTPEYDKEKGITIWSNEAKAAMRRIIGSVEEAVKKTEEGSSNGVTGDE